MKILLLGKKSSRIEECLLENGHSFVRVEEKINLQYLLDENFDFGISYGYKHILKKDVIDYFSGKLINLHISYLPYNRGYDPTLWSIYEGTPKGVTIHLIDEGVDTGDILLQKEVHFDFEFDTLKTSYDSLSQTIEELLIKNINTILYGELTPQKQIGVGSFHKSTEKNLLMNILSPLFWDTPIKIIRDDYFYPTLPRGVGSYQLATSMNSKNIYDLASSENVRVNSINKDLFSYEKHCQWYSSRLQKGNFYVIQHNNIFGGYVRFDREQAKSDNNVFNVTIAISENLRGLGLASKALRSLCPQILFQNAHSIITACIFKNNIASQKLFNESGFCFTHQLGELLYYEYKPYCEII